VLLKTVPDGTVIICPPDTLLKTVPDGTVVICPPGAILKTVPDGTVVISCFYLQNCHRAFYNDGYF